MITEKPVVVTGGAGFIGSHLVERLLQDGHRVLVIDDLSTGSLENLSAVEAHPALEVLSARVSGLDDLAERIKTAGYIFHLAASVGVDLVLRSPLAAMKNNLRETECLLDAASRASVPVLFTSTSEVYGKSNKAAFSEEDDLLIGPPHLARWSYACAKLLDEFLCLACHLERGLPVTIARLFNTVGPRQRGHYGMVLPRFIQAAREGKPLRVFGDGNQTRCFCYVRDTVEALLRLAGNPSSVGQVINVGQDQETTINELAEKVVAKTGSGSPIVHVPYEQAYAPGFEDMYRRVPVITKLKRITGFRPQMSLDEIITRTAQLKKAFR